MFLSVCRQLKLIQVTDRLTDRHTIQTKAWILYVPLSHLVNVCLFCHLGPVSVREQIKMINEKFAGAAGNQWQEPYPLHRYTLLQTMQQQLTSSQHIITVILQCYSAVVFFLNDLTGSRKESGKEQLGDFFGGSNSYAECYPAT